MRLHPLLLQLPVLLLLPKLQLHLLLPPLILLLPKPQIALLRCVPNWAVSFFLFTGALSGCSFSECSIQHLFTGFLCLRRMKCNLATPHSLPSLHCILAFQRRRTHARARTHTQTLTFKRAHANTHKHIYIYIKNLEIETSSCLICARTA